MRGLTALERQVLIFCDGDGFDLRTYGPVFDALAERGLIARLGPRGSTFYFAMRPEGHLALRLDALARQPAG